MPLPVGAGRFLHRPVRFVKVNNTLLLTRSFGVDAFSIRWYAQVRGHELVTRRDLLPDEPDHPRAAQRYYKLQLGKLVELPHPIPSRDCAGSPLC